MQHILMIGYKLMYLESVYIFYKILISTNINETTEDTDKSHFLDVFQESLRKKNLIQAISINIIIICCDIPILLEEYQIKNVSI